LVSDSGFRDVKVKATAIPLVMKGETKNLEIMRPENGLKSNAKFIFNQPKD